MDSGVRGEELKSKILETLRDAGIDMSYCRGQGYDGAANMSSILYPVSFILYPSCLKLLSSGYGKTADKRA